MSFESDVARKLGNHARRIRRLEILPSGSDPAAASSGAPVDGPYIVSTANATLTGERVLQGGSGLALTDQGPNASLYVDVLAGPGLGFLSGSLFAVASDITGSLVEGTISACLNDNYGPASGTYVVISTHADLSAERVLQAGSGLLLTDQGGGASVFLDIDAGSGLEFDGNQLELSDHSHNSGSISDFDEAAQDAVGGILVDTGSIEFTYDDPTPDISACVNPAGVSHDGLADVSSDDHHDEIHAASHIRGGGDEIDGDQLDIDWNPSNYTPTTGPTEVSNVDHLTAHLAGIDAELNTLTSGASAIGARVHTSTPDTITHNTATVITFDVERYDTDGIWQSGTPTRLTANTAGKYVISGHVRWEANGTGERFLAIERNGTTRLAAQRVLHLGTTEVEMSISTVHRLAAGAYVELEVFQNSGSDLDIEEIDAYSAEFAMQRLSED